MGSEMCIRDSIIPRYNYERLKGFDTEKMLSEREIVIVPVQTFMEAAVEALLAFSSPEELVKSLKSFPSQKLRTLY